MKTKLDERAISLALMMKVPYDTNDITRKTIAIMKVVRQNPSEKDITTLMSKIKEKLEEIKSKDYEGK